MERDIEDRYYSIKVALKVLFDQHLTGREREVNSHNWHFLCHDNGEDMRLYKVNAGKFIYDMTPQELADLLEAVQSTLDDYLLEGGEQNLWAMDYVVAEAQRGTLEAFNNLSQRRAAAVTMERNGLGSRQAGAKYRPAVAVSAQADDAHLARQPSRKGLHHRRGARLLR